MAQKRILILSVAGIGNTVLQSPLISAILASSDYVTDVLFGDEGMKAVFEFETRIHLAYVMPTSTLRKLELILQLRRNRYDISVACFPSNRFEYNLFPFLLDVKQRIVHSYQSSRVRSLSFLSNVTVPVDESLHDVEQNLNLLEALGMNPATAETKLSFSISSANEAFASDFVEKLDARPIIGIHPAGTRFLEEKNWPAENFASLIVRLRTRYNVILFGKEEDTRPFSSIAGISLCNKNLNDSAALIKRCALFVSVDTGLMHVASVFGVKQLVLWGPTRYSRTRPWSENAVILGRTDLTILRYPFSDTRARFHHPDPQSFMREITVGRVFDTILAIIHSN